MDSGHDMTIAEILEVVERSGFNVTLTGGDPIYQASRLEPLLRALQERGYTVWLYTGFRYEELLEMPQAVALLKYIEAVVDGPFIAELRDTSLCFRGSSNQRIIKPSEWL